MTSFLQGSALSHSSPHRAGRGRGQVYLVASLGKNLSNWLDGLAFEKWAPKSSRAWRLPPKAASTRERAAAESADEEALQELNRRIAAAAEGRRGSSSNLDAPPASRSFDEVNDSEIAQSLSRRIAQTEGTASPTTEALTGDQLWRWIVNKYGKSYDLSVVRRQLPGGGPLIALNIMWVHLDQQSFPMTREEYMAKLDNMAMCLNAWGQAEVVRAFFLAPAKSKNGLPGRRPVVGNAISLRLNLSDALMREWFGTH